MAFSLSNVFSSLQKAAPSLVQQVIGIDIGSSAVKIVQLERSEQAPILKTYGSIELGPYLDLPAGKSIDTNQEILTKAIVDVMRESGATANTGVLSLPLQTGFVTVVPVTVEEGETLESKIPIAARKYIPVPLTEVTLDWVQLPQVGPSGDVDEKKQMVLLVALQNDAVVMHSSLLSNIGMSGQPMELEPFSLHRAVPMQIPNITVMIDIGAEISKLFIFQDNSLMKLHRMTAGGSQITEKLASLHQLDFAAAEQLKRSMASATPDHVADIKRATAAVLDAPLLEFKRIIEKYEKTVGTSVGRVILSGGVVTSPEVQRYIGDTLQRPVGSIFPFAQVGYPAFMEDTLHSIGPLFAPSLGAALRLLS